MNLQFLNNLGVGCACFLDRAFADKGMFGCSKSAWTRDLGVFPFLIVKTLGKKFSVWGYFGKKNVAVCSGGDKNFAQTSFPNKESVV